MPTVIPKELKYISIHGARVNNLKNISLEIPRDKLIVVTGLSGSGKSSLAFDTLYAEGQRRYVESLSSYARQFLGRISKPEVDYIKGIPPAIAIEQKVNTRNPRSTVGTSTELYDYIKLLFARIGKTFSPISGKIVKRHSVTDVVDFVFVQPKDATVLILSPFAISHKTTPKADLATYKRHFDMLIQQGFTRVEVKNKIEKITDFQEKFKPTKDDINIVVDRILVNNDEDTISRVADSVQTAFYEGRGECVIKVMIGDKWSTQTFSNRFEADGIIFEEPNVHTFSFNNPVGACPTCEGFGTIIGIDENLVIPNKNLSVYQDAVACWKGEKMEFFKNELILSASKFDFPIHRPYFELTDEQKKLLWTGNQHFEGIDKFFKMLERENYKIQYRVMLSRYRGKTKCPTCNGSRLKPEASYVKINNKSVKELVLMPIWDLQHFFDNIVLDDYEFKVAKRILIEIKNRLQFVIEVGLGYLTLNRLSSSLSGGESQRINLATSLGSSLVGSLYILDEPSIGLHSRDTELLIKVLRQLQRLGNTVLIVEHDEEIILAASEIIDIGPLAGSRGGEVVFQGDHVALLKEEKSLTARYITGKEKIPVPDHRRVWNNFVEITGACENNLKSIDVKFPLNIMTVVTGVSGSGKSSLVRDVLFTALSRQYNQFGDRIGNFGELKGDLKMIDTIEFVDQGSIGRSSRSNPVTYIKAYDEIRALFAEQQTSKINGFTPSHFSFNVDGGRCEECQGDGIIKVEMQFMADVHLVCESCNGKRFKDDVLEVTYQHKSIYDVLELTVDEAVEFFGQKEHNTEKRINAKLKPLQDVGLSYVKLGQPSSTLSGGESQRLKLASFLGQEKVSQTTLFIFDEPTTGLHFHDIRKLLQAFDALIERGHTVIVIEHNLDVVKCADWIIDLGPEGGNSGGHLVFAGTPENIVKCEPSYTGKYLKKKLE